MKPTRQGRGLSSLRSVGRGFWLGLLASLLLHGLLIANGQFELLRLDDPPALVARLELVEPQALAPHPPKAAPKTIASPPASPPQVEPAAAPTPSAPPLTSAVADIPPIAEEAPPSPPPPAPDAPSPQQQRPYAALTEAAQNLRTLPSHIEIVYQLTGFLSGRQTHVWQQTGDRYVLTTEAEATGLAGLFVRGKMLQRSEGRITSLGLMPERYESQRPGGKQEILRFDYAGNVIESIRIDSKHGERKQELPMLTGVQDPLSSIYQLAMAARSGKDSLLVAASAKRVKGYPYRTLGEEALDTALGKQRAVHVTRAGETDKGAVHLWLSPDNHFLPVKVSYVDEDGSTWVLEAVSLTSR